MSGKRIWLSLGVLMLLALPAWPGPLEAASADNPGTAVEADGPQPGLQKQFAGDGAPELWFIPLPGERLLMHAVVLRPEGQGPFPLAVINHGSSQNAVERAGFREPRYRTLTDWLVSHGYVVVLPIRPGHGETGGPYFEDQGRCANADYERAGIRTAFSISAAVDYMTSQPFVKASGAVVIGQSAGGWGSLALASENPPKVSAIVNFAGGRGGHVDNLPDNNCAPDRLVTAAADFGRTARIPTLWLYARNDTYFRPDLSQGMYRAYRDAGGKAEFHLLPPVSGEGHLMIEAGDARKTWLPVLASFLSKAS